MSPSAATETLPVAVAAILEQHDREVAASYATWLWLTPVVAAVVVAVQTLLFLVAYDIAVYVAIVGVPAGLVLMGASLYLRIARPQLESAVVVAGRPVVVEVQRHGPEGGAHNSTTIRLTDCARYAVAYDTGALTPVASDPTERFFVGDARDAFLASLPSRGERPYVWSRGTAAPLVCIDGAVFGPRALDGDYERLGP